MLARLHSSKLFYPTLAVGSAIALYSAQQQYSLFSTIRNETASPVFKGDGAWVDLKISKIEQVSADTKKFTFQFPESSDVSGLVTASAVLAKYVTPKGSNVIRPYTPTSDIGTKGEIDFVIKHYEKGKFTTHLFGLNVNDTVSFKGPILKWKWEPNSFDEITLIGAGTGITPLYQLAHHIAQNPEDHTKIKLFYGNKTPSDILLKSELDSLAAKYPHKFHVEYFVDNTDGAAAADAEKLNKGFITKNDLSTKAAKSTEKTQVFVCGPPPFMNAYSGPKVSPSDQGDLTGILSELGFTKDQVFKF